MYVSPTHLCILFDFVNLIILACNKFHVYLFILLHYLFLSYKIHWFNSYSFVWYAIQFFLRQKNQVLVGPDKLLVEKEIVKRVVTSERGSWAPSPDRREALVTSRRNKLSASPFERSSACPPPPRPPPAPVFPLIYCAICAKTVNSEVICIRMFNNSPLIGV